MRLEYIAHSCFVLETNARPDDPFGRGIKIAFDPWITGGAYHNQWQLFPKPVDISPVINSDVILISHGHEDHMHHESLKLINKKAKVFFPFQWRKGIVKYMKHLGFKSVQEAVSFKTYSHKNVRITYMGYSLESVIVIECEGKVIVNINDALNSNHETASTYLLEKIKKRFPKIDFLLSGWSGAGYFPNKVHYKGKDDVEVGKIREQYFADNFCKFTKFLQPKIALAFAPGFALLNKGNRWINEVRFPREQLASYYHDHFQKDSGIQFPITYPGDYFVDEEFHAVSKLHELKHEMDMYKDLDAVFAKEIAEADRVEYFPEEKMQPLVEKLNFWLNKNKVLYKEDVVKDSVFSIKFTDVAKHNFFNIFYHDGKPVAQRSESSGKEDRLIITTKASLLALNLEKPWGGDLLSLGYGFDVEVFEELSLEKNLDIVCVRLITRFPIFKDDVLANAGRVAKYYFRNPSLTNLWIKQKVKLKPYVNKYPFNERDHWITYKKCDLCKVCNIPELDFNKLNLIPS